MASAKVKLVDVEPSGTERVFAHVHRDQGPHTWEWVDAAVWPDYPDGCRLRRARRNLRIGLREAAKRLGLRTVSYSDLERGRKVLAPGLEMDDVIAALRLAEER